MFNSCVFDISICVFSRIGELFAKRRYFNLLIISMAMTKILRCYLAFTIMTIHFIYYFLLLLHEFYISRGVETKWRGLVNKVGDKVPPGPRVSTPLISIHCIRNVQGMFNNDVTLKLQFLSHPPPTSRSESRKTCRTTTEIGLSL